MSLDVFNAKANQNKLGNLFLGFFEGLFIDGRVHVKEIEALIKWVEHYPQSVDLPHFETLYNLLLKATEDPEFLLQKHKEISEMTMKFALPEGKKEGGTIRILYFLGFKHVFECLFIYLRFVDSV